MAFICTLLDDRNYVRVLRDGNSYTVSTQVGYDDTSNKIYYAVVYLDLIPSGEHEVRFCLDEFDGTTSHFYSYWDGRDVAKFICKDDRKKILDCVISLMHNLICQVRPPVVVMCSKYNNPVCRSNIKAVRVAECFEVSGYTVQTFDPYLGHMVWRMELRGLGKGCLHAPAIPSKERP